MALFFNGTSHYVNAGDSPSLWGTGCTISCWVNLTSLANAYTGVVVTDGINLRSLYVKSNGTLAVYIAASGGYASYDGTGSNTLVVNKLYHLAFTYDSTAGLVGYVNGASDATAANNGNLSATTVLTFGNDPGNAGRFLSGSMSDVAIYSDALSAANIALLGSGLSPLAVSAATLTGYWPLAGSSAARDRGPFNLLAKVYGASAFNDPAFPMPYPRQLLSPIFAEGEMSAMPTVAGATFLAAWAKNSNLPVLGTGTY